METSNIIWTVIAVAILGAIIVAGLMRPDDVEAPISPETETVEEEEEEQEEVEGDTDTIEADIEPIHETVRATIRTNRGDIEVELYGQEAPITVGNFVKLAGEGFYDGTTFHRVIPDFMIQGGDPLSRNQENRQLHGTGGPGYTFEDEINERLIVRGELAMANSGPNTNGSQFFIVTAEATPHLDGRHTNFGTVIEGMDIVDAIEQVERDARDNPLEPVIIETIVIHGQDSPEEQQ
jgi:cyclophilin family peptidyl-prolyl cis-trans isomerase